MEVKTETQVVEQNAVTESVAAETPKRKTRTRKAAEKTVKPIVPKDIDPEQYVTVRNGFQGRLVYVSKHTGERFVWDQFGAEQEMELRELKNAKNSYKKFFENNWFMFDEDWIVDYLGVQRFYRNAVRIEDFDEIFQKDAETMNTATHFGVLKVSSGIRTLRVAPSMVVFTLQRLRHHERMMQSR